MTDELLTHLANAVAMLKRGKVVPFLGAGVNVWDRGDGAWDPWAEQHFPSGGELATYLAEEFRPATAGPVNLERISLDISIDPGEASLYGVLHDVFDVDAPPTDLHHLIAAMPDELRAKGWRPLEVVVTTNYDDSLERSFRARDIQPHVLTYIASGPGAGRFVHHFADEDAVVVTDANTYMIPVDDDGRLEPTVVKLHGAVDRVAGENDSFVITEDHYIEYLALGDITGRLPKNVLTRLADSHFLFLGYSLQDWNVRAVLHRLWKAQKADRGSWAIQYGVDRFAIESWGKRGVRILDVALDEYVAALAAALDRLPSRLGPSS